MKSTVETQTISREELGRMLSVINSPMFVSFVSRTPVPMRKTGNPYVGVLKTSRKFKIIIGFDYENSVNGRREREGKDTDFKSGEGREPWFKVISKSLVTDKKTGEKFYIRYQYLEDSTIESEFTFNGDPIGKQLFESYMTERSNYENQGLDNPLRFQVCDLRNILEISIMGGHYVLTD